MKYEQTGHERSCMHFRQMRLPSIHSTPFPEVFPADLTTNRACNVAAAAAAAAVVVVVLSSGVWRAWQARERARHVAAVHGCVACCSSLSIASCGAERERGEGKYVSVYNIPHLESTLLVLGTDKHASKGRYLNDVRTEGEGGLAKRR